MYTSVAFIIWLSQSMSYSDQYVRASSTFLTYPDCVYIIINICVTHCKYLVLTINHELKRRIIYYNENLIPS